MTTNAEFYRRHHKLEVHKVLTRCIQMYPVTKLKYESEHFHIRTTSLTAADIQSRTGSPNIPSADYKKNRSRINKRTNNSTPDDRARLSSNLSNHSLFPLITFSDTAINVPAAGFQVTVRRRCHWSFPVNTSTGVSPRGWIWADGSLGWFCCFLSVEGLIQLTRWGRS